VYNLKIIYFCFAGIQMCNGKLFSNTVGEDYQVELYWREKTDHGTK
jgi:hypothetical protein